MTFNVIKAHVSQQANIMVWIKIIKDSEEYARLLQV